MQNEKYLELDAIAAPIPVYFLGLDSVGFPLGALSIYST